MDESAVFIPASNQLPLVTELGKASIGKTQRE